MDCATELAIVRRAYAKQILAAAQVDPRAWKRPLLKCAVRISSVQDLG
jgi:hypothetical protein